MVDAPERIWVCRAERVNKPGWCVSELLPVANTNADEIIGVRRTEYIRADIAERELAEARAETIDKFVAGILHGDEEHRDWLVAAGEAYKAGNPLPPPNGKGRAEAAESERDRLAAEVERKDAALEPFATYLDQASFDLDNNGNPLPDEQGMGWVYLNVGHFRCARASLKTGEKGE